MDSQFHKETDDDLFQIMNIKLRIEEKKIDLVTSLIPLCKTYDELMNVLNTITLSAPSHAAHNS